MTNTGNLSGFRPAVMARWLADNWNIIKGTDGEVYRWHEGVYVPAEETVGAAVVAVHGTHYQRGAAEGIINWLKFMPGRDVSKPLKEGLLNLKNGVLNL